MQGTVGLIRFNDGSCAVMFCPLHQPSDSVPDYKVCDLDGLNKFLASINVTLTEEQFGRLKSTKTLLINNLNPPDDILKRYGLI